MQKTAKSEIWFRGKKKNGKSFFFFHNVLYGIENFRAARAILSSQVV